MKRRGWVVVLQCLSLLLIFSIVTLLQQRLSTSVIGWATQASEEREDVHWGAHTEMGTKIHLFFYSKLAVWVKECCLSEWKLERVSHYVPQQNKREWHTFFDSLIFFPVCSHLKMEQSQEPPQLHRAIWRAEEASSQVSLWGELSFVQWREKIQHESSKLLYNVQKN